MADRVDCAEVYRRASLELHDEGSFSNLPEIVEVEQVRLAVGGLQFGHHELDRHKLAADQCLLSDGESANDYPLGFCDHQPPPRPWLAPSEAIGITYHKKNKQWEAHLWVKERQVGKRKKKGAQVFLGNFRTPEEAKAAHDRAAIKLDVRETAKGKPYPLNFPESAQSDYMEKHADWTPRDFLWKIRRFSLKFSKGRSEMKGVSVRSRKVAGTASAEVRLHYEAKISQTLGGGEKRTFDLGNFSCEEDAGRAYDRALLFLKGGDSVCVTNFRPSEYSVAEIQEVGRKLFGTVQ